MIPEISLDMEFTTQCYPKRIETQQIMVNLNFSILGNISYQQERIKKAMRAGYSGFNQSITGIKTATELKPALQVKQSSLILGKGNTRGSSGMRQRLPPMEKVSKQHLDVTQSPEKSFIMAQDPYAFEEFKYTSSIGKRKLEVLISSSFKASKG
jgi:hypothetical protein